MGWKMSETENTQISDGLCLRHALNAAGIENNLPSWIPLDAMPEICEQYGLQWYESGIVEVFSTESVILIINTDRGTLHAEYVAAYEDVASLGWSIVRVIRLNG